MKNSTQLEVSVFEGTYSQYELLVSIFGDIFLEEFYFKDRTQFLDAYVQIDPEKITLKTLQRISDSDLSITILDWGIIIGGKK